MKKLLVVLLTLSLLMASLAACGGKSDSSGGGESSTGSDSEAAPESEADKEESQAEEGDADAEESTDTDTSGLAEITYPVTEENASVTWWHGLRAPSYQTSYDDNIVFQAIEKNTGIDIEWINPASGTETEQLNMLLVSGELPDIIQIDGYLESSGGAAAGVDDGNFVDLTDYLEEYAPDYLKTIVSSDLCYQMATTADNRVVQFLQIKQTAPQYSRVNVRNDIMEEIGWADRLPETIDDYTEMFGAMKEAGYYGYRVATNGMDSQLVYPYGISTGFYLDEEGKVAYGPWKDEFRDYLRQVREWIEAGYVHPDWTSSDTDTAALFAGKEIGMYITPSDIAYGLAKLNGYEITCVNYPRLNSGDEFRFETTTWDPVPADGIRTVVTTDCEEAGKLQIAMALLNYGYTEEGALLYNWGVEGETYTVDSEGNKTFTDLILNNDKIPMSDGQYIYKLHFGPKLAEPDVLCNPGTIGDPQALYWRELYSDDPTVNSDAILFCSLTVEQSTARGDIMTDIETYRNESILQFLLGDKDINDDAAWQEYMDTLQGMGIEEAIAITQEAQDEFMAKSIPTDWAFH